MFPDFLCYELLNLLAKATGKVKKMDFKNRFTTFLSVFKHFSAIKTEIVNAPTNL